MHYRSQRSAAGLLAGLVALPLLANQPVTNVTAPTGTLYVANFPFSAPITFTIYNGPTTADKSTTAELNNVNVLNVSVNGAPIFETSGNPFDKNNACTEQVLPPKTLSCSAIDANNASITIPWSIPGPGTYVILVSLKHKGDVGADEETVMVNLVTAEYPAPPSVANKYINGTSALKSASAKVRGCVLNEIAREHGQNTKYGPNGGPYNEPLIRSDVYRFWTGTCGVTWPAGVPIP